MANIQLIAQLVGEYFDHCRNKPGRGREEILATPGLSKDDLKLLKEGMDDAEACVRLVSKRVPQSMH